MTLISDRKEKPSTATHTRGERMRKSLLLFVVIKWKKIVWIIKIIASCDDATFNNDRLRDE